MDKTAIKNFSIWARNKLIADITYKAGLLGITEDGIKDALPQSTQDAEFYDIGTKEPYAIHGEEIRQRKDLVAVIRKRASQLEYKDAYRNVIEEVAYTWFNRLIAIRFMEVNDYMPAHIRVLSSESTKLEPDLVTTPFDAEIEFTQEETENIIQLKNDNQVDALFRILFIKQCNALNAYLPKLFEKTSDYTELLLNVSVTDQDGIVYHLTHDIKEDDFNISNIGEDGKPTGQVEIIGWMYQYYNTEPKDETFALLKKNVKITKERIPAATQLFTPDWIVRYMVENSVGRLWLEGHEDESTKSAKLRENWKYYLDEAEQEADVEEQLKAIREEYKNIKPEEIKVIDPCMGSGHILVYAFDVLMQIYESYGYSQRDAAKSIVENNIYGLDIDDRAFQLAYFAIMMKARSYNRRFLTLEIEPNLCAIQESNGLQYDKDMGDFLLGEEHRETLQYLLHTFVDAKEYGSILNVEKRDYDGFLQAWEAAAEATLENVFMIGWYMECNQIVPILAKQAKILSQQYDVVVTNPPYMTITNGCVKLNDYVKRHYSISKADLYAVFITKCSKLSKLYISMITQHSWMFLSTFEEFRKDMFKEDFIVLAHLGSRAFEEISGEVVQTVAFVQRKTNIPSYVGSYSRLVAYGSQIEKETKYLLHNSDYYINKTKFNLIPSSPIAYWISDTMFECFKNKCTSEYAKCCKGLDTGNNNLFLRLWFEVQLRNTTIGDNKGWWIPYNKGGAFRKWYGNNFYLVNWKNGGEALSSFKGSNIRNRSYHFREGVTWSTTTGGSFSGRKSPKGFLFDSKGCMAFPYDSATLQMLLAEMNAKTFNYFLDIITPTLDFNPGPVGKAPFIMYNDTRIDELVDECCAIAKEEWDDYEISWDFEKHPFVRIAKRQETKENRLDVLFNTWKELCNKRYERIKKNEEEINKYFIRLYCLENEIIPDVNETEISIRRADWIREIKSLISYAIGCMFGRYSLTRDGLVCTSPHLELDEYDKFIPTKDNIILITDEEYFKDDMVDRFVEWMRLVFGEEVLEYNLDLIGNALDTKGNTSRGKIRNYFLCDFYKEHCNIFSVSGSGKRPIYWLFDSGKQNGFKALIYMHRYNADTIGNLRVDYLHRMERIYESEINRMQDTIDNSSNAREVTAASKRKEKLQKQLKECQEYDEKISHLALSRIEIDLDDGVKVNYEKVQTAKDGKKYQVLAKI